MTELTTPIGGNSWTFSPLTWGMKDQFSAWIISRARESAADMEMLWQRRARKIRQILTDDERMLALNDESYTPLDEVKREEFILDLRYMEASAARQTKEFKDDKDVGHYHFHGKYCQDSLTTPEGTAKLMQLMLHPKHPGITIQQCLELYDKYTEACVDAVREVMGLPKKLKRSSIKKTQENTGETQS